MTTRDVQYGIKSEYRFDNAWLQARERLAALEAQLDPGTIGYLQALGVGEGWHCLEVGGERPWRLALITMFQFVEDLSDRQAADAVRARIDWKYALGLDLDNPGFDHTVLSEFRGRLIDRGAERLLSDVMLG